MPRVSIIVPTFNLARYIGRSLESVFAQTYTDYEVIVVDDGSTDNTRDVLARYAGKLRYHHQMNKGVAAARNEGFTHAAGELHSGRVERRPPAARVVPRELEIVGLARHADCDVADTGPRVQQVRSAHKERS